MKSANVPPEVSTYFREIGRKSGKKLMEERGSEYFSKISKLRKTHGRQGQLSHHTEGGYQNLANFHGVSRQRIHQIITTKGEKLVSRSEYTNENEWRKAVVSRYFNKK